MQNGGGGWRRGGVFLVAEWSEEYLNKNEKKSGLKKVEGLQLSFEEPGLFFSFFFFSYYFV